VRECSRLREDEEKAEEEEAAIITRTPAIKKARRLLKRNQPQMQSGCQTCPQALCKSGEANQVKGACPERN